MQLNRLINYHKALSDPTRIRILALLAQSPLHGQALAERLGMTPPTITHHMTKLREAGLIKERRDKNTIYFTLDEVTLKNDAQATIDVILKTERIMNEVDERMEPSEKEKVLNNFLTPDGRLKQIPVQCKKKLIVFEFLIKGLEIGRKYPEKEINEHIKQFHEDYATIRREFIINHYMCRENGVYELNPPELWAKS